MEVVLASPWIHPAAWCLKISVSSCRHRLQLHLHRRHRPPVSKHAMWHDDDDTLWKHQYGASPMTCTRREHIAGLQKHWQPTLSPAGCAAILAVSRKHAMLEAASVPLLFSANWEMFGEELPVLTKHIYTHTHILLHRNYVSRWLWCRCHWVCLACQAADAVLPTTPADSWQPRQYSLFYY